MAESTNPMQKLIDEIRRREIINPSPAVRESLEQFAQAMETVADEQEPEAKRKKLA